MSAYLQVRIKPKNQRASVLLTKAEMKIFRSVLCMVWTLTEVLLLFSEAQILVLAPIDVQKIRKDIWRTYLAGNSTALLHRRFTALDKFMDALEIPTEVLNVLKRPTLF